MTSKYKRLTQAMCLGCLIAATAPGFARVLRVHVDHQSTIMEGHSFGNVGPYRKISGTVVFGFDPDNPANQRITDIERAPLDAQGLVEASANFMVLKPVNETNSRHVAWLEVSNRGGKASLKYFNNATSFASDPVSADDFGNGLLMRQGLTVIWVGWEFDVRNKPGELHLDAPVAKEGDKPIRGLVRSDWVVDQAKHTLGLGHHDLKAYPVADIHSKRNVLTMRDGREAKRHIVPRKQWRFARQSESGQVVPDRRHIYSANGFEKGKIYEMVYVAENPPVVGTGLAAIRDMLSYAKYNKESLFPVKQGIAFGVSQTGRFLRQFLYQRFNVDEKGRKVFDGMLVHAAGAGRGSFNHRFAQPSRDAHRYSAFFYPTDIFPFTSRVQTDPVTGKKDGLLAHYKNKAMLPRIFYTNSGYEYWGRAASLIHLSVDGKRDIPPLPNERIYHLSSGQHFVEPWPPTREQRLPNANAWQGDPLDYLVNLRALMVRLVAWVADDKPPPASIYPTIANGTLVPIDKLTFPSIPGIKAPRVAEVAYRVNYGPHWDQGIITNQPPKLGPKFPIRVPQVNAMGNERAGIENVEVKVPLATYAPWNLRAGLPHPEELTDFLGTFIPLPWSTDDKHQGKDPRPAIATLYNGHEHYLGLVKQAANRLVHAGFLLKEDRVRVLTHARVQWNWISRHHHIRKGAHHRPQQQTTSSSLHGQANSR